MRQKASLTILLYHGVAVHNNTGIYNYRKKFITPQSFERHIAYLRKHYNIVALDEAIARLAKGQKLSPYPLAITFDDGYENIYNHAYSVLTKYNAPATVFVVTDFINKKTPLWMDRLEYAIGNCKSGALGIQKDKIRYDEERREYMKSITDDKKYMELVGIENRCQIKLADFTEERSVYTPLSWHQIQEMQRKNIAVGAHTKSHPILTRLSQTHAREEIEHSRSIIENKVGNLSDTFSYPNGQHNDFDENTKHMVRDAGFQAALTTLPGINTIETDLFALKRFTMDGTNDFATFIATISGVRLFLKHVKDYAKGSHLF